jgi:hypothetical protein
MVQGISAPNSTQQSTIAHHYEAFLGQLSVKGLAAVHKHDEFCDAESARTLGALWKRLAGDLGKLAGHATEVQGQVAVKFHIADGKYKQQVFALEDTRQGYIAVYLPDVVQLAMRQKILATGASAHHYKVRGGTEQVQFTQIDAETKDLSACKGMVGWGRRALRAEVNGQTPEEHVHAIEQMCELAAQKWAAPAA